LTRVVTGVCVFGKFVILVLGNVGVLGKHVILVLGKDCTDCILTGSVSGILTSVVSGVGFLGGGGGIASCDNVRTRVMLFLLVVLLLP
jgi:uncharacterized membrane protein YhiD involved in acid resistance